MNPGPGFEIIDTYNGGNRRVRANIATEEAARKILRTKLAL
jgi:hypothetical protein